MADWKKISTSGSNISDFVNDVGYLSDADSFNTSSANGASLFANNSKELIFSSGSSAQGGIKISASISSSLNVLDFSLENIPNAALVNNSLHIGEQSVTLGASGSNFSGLVASGSFSGSFEGDGSGLSGIASALDISGSSGNGSVAILTQDLNILGTANEIETSASAQTITIGLPNDVVIGQDLTVTNNLVVLGTASFQSTENLDVADRFIRLASGSTTVGDGGFVIQQTASNGGAGEAFAYDSGVNRWGLTSSLDPTSTAFTPDAFMTVSVIGTSSNANDAPNKYEVAGNIFIGIDENIWIYV